MVPIKQRLNNKPIGVKCKALKDLAKGMANKDVTATYGVPKVKQDVRCKGHATF